MPKTRKQIFVICPPMTISSLRVTLIVISVKTQMATVKDFGISNEGYGTHDLVIGKS